MYVCMYVCMCVCAHFVMLCNMLSGETSLIKAEPLYAYYKAMLIQRINFLDVIIIII